jgi:hypothetical protein
MLADFEVNCTGKNKHPLTICSAMGACNTLINMVKLSSLFAQSAA